MERLMYFQEPADQEDDYLSAAAAAVNHHIPTARKRSPSSSSLYTRQPNPKRERSISLPATSPAVPILRRCISDPLRSPENAPIGASAGSRGMCRAVSAPENELIAATDPIGESPNSKRLKRMKEKMREMSKWCDEVIAEGDDDDDHHLVGAEVVNNEAPKDDEIESSENEEVEAVSVEKKGECLIIHMKCPCSKAYQFLLTQNNSNCYYKLM